MPMLFGRTRILTLLFLLATAAAQDLKTQPTVYSGKPDIVAFEKMENARLAAAQKSIDQIVAVKGARTIANTLEPYDEAARQLNAAAYFSVLMQQVHPDAAYRDHATAMTTKVSSAQTALSLNQDVYHALVSLDVSKADPATKYYVQRQLLEFRLAGVDKDEATRTKLKKLQDQLTDDQSAFDRNISDDQKTIELASVSELDGLPQDFIDNHKPGPDGKIKITTNYPDLVPMMTFANSNQLRHDLWEAFDSRAYPKNRAVLQDMMQCRYQIAVLIGYPSWADYNAADKMIVKGSNIAKFISDVDTAARPIAQREFQMQLAEKRKTDPQAKEIMAFESRHLSELVRRSQYDFNSESVRPYLPYAEVKQGIMNTAAALFHVSFQQEPNSAVWDSSVETWDVIENGKAIGRFYLDMHPRPGKYSHAQMSGVLDGVRGKQLPEAILVCNFPKPTATDPALMDYSDATTFFHEFGHLMHHILGGQQQWAGISGISMESDFIEAPSQMLEEWMRSPQVLASFARNYKTGEPIPAELVARMDRASAFGRGNWVSGQNAYSAISYDIYKDDPKTVDLDSVTFHDLQNYTSYVPIPPDAHIYANFNHLAGYSSAYYTYMWDKVIALDFYQQFDQQNLLAGDTPMRYRRQVLEPGGSMSANDLVKNFLGRPQNMDAFQKWMAEEFKDAPKAKISGAP
ncbi:MAG: M3 family metallopeptidase [Candidatus Korobacteraceae bacterium]